MQPQDPTSNTSSWGSPPPPPPPSNWGAPPPGEQPPGGSLPPPPPAWGGYAPPVGVVRIATAGRRIGGALVDGIVTGIIGQILLSPFQMNETRYFAASGGYEIRYEGFAKYAVASVIVGVVIALLNDVVLVVARGGSVGKLAVGMKIVNARDGSSVDSTVAFKRLLLDLIGYPALLLMGAMSAGLGALMIFTLGSIVLAIVNIVMLFADERHQTLNDKIADTVIVTTK